MASEPVLEVVPEEALVEGAMIVVHVAAPSPPHGAATTSSPTPRTTAATSAAAGVAVGPKVIMGHPTFYAPDDIRLDESVILAHRALSEVQHVLHREDEGLADERRRLQLWAAMHGSIASIYRWRPSTNATLTPSGPLPMRRSCTHQPRPGPAPSSSRRRTLLCAQAG
jgi:hypothetical protein